MPLSSFVTTAQQMRDSVSEVARKAGGLAAPAGVRLGSQLDFSDYLSEQQKRILVTGIKEVLNSAMDASFQELRNSTQRQRDPSLMPSFEKATSQIQGLLPSFRAVIQEALSQEAVKGQRYAMDAMKKFGMPAPVDPSFYRSFEYLDPSRGQERLRELGPLNEPPRVINGVESQFEGAMLPGRNFDISKLTRNFGNVAAASGSATGYFPAIAQNIQGATPTSQLRQQGAQQQIEQVDQQALIQSYQVLSEIKTTSQQTLDNYKLQNQEINLQIQALTQGVEPAIAEQFSGLQANYELQQQQLEIRRQALIAQGQNEKAVNQAYVAESQALAKIYEQNKASIIQYQQKQKILEQIQNASNILESNLTNAISNSIEVLISGSGTVKQVLAETFRSIGQAFIQMAAQIIAKQLAIAALAPLLRAFNLGPTPISNTSFGASYFNPVTGLGNAGPNFGFANGGIFSSNNIQPFATGGIVTRPTFFKYAKGGEMQNGLMGEAGPEAIMPLKRGADGKLGVAARLDGAMSRYRRPPGTAGAGAGGGIGEESGGSATAAMTPIDVRYSVERINSVDYVTTDQFQAGMRQAASQGAERGQQLALRRLQQSPSARRRVGI
jgi:hypothetical protein